MIRRDLADMNEVNTCLALHAVANIASLEMAEVLAEEVLKLLVSPYVYVLTSGPRHRLYRRRRP